MTESSNDKIWLIKSSGRIFGPLNYDEVVQGLRSKEIVILDEISKPFHRWKYVRDEDAFENIVIELRNKDQVHHETTQTGTHSLTESTTEIVRGNYEKTVYKLPDVEEGSTDSNKIKPESKIFGVTPDTKGLNRILSLLLVLLVIGITFFYTREKPNTTLALSFEESKKRGIYLKNIGDLNLAKYEFMNANNLNPDDEETALGLASVLISMQDTVTAERLLNSILEKNPSEGIQKRVLNYLGVISLYHFDLEKGEAKFKEALSVDPEYTAVLFNMGMTLYLRKSLDEAETYFNKSIKYGNDSSSLYIMLINIINEKSKTDPSYSSKYNDLADIYNLIATRSMHNSQELQIAYAYTLFKIKKTKQAEEVLVKSLDYDPQESVNFVKDSEFFEDKSDWYYLNIWLKEMSAEFKSSSRVEALLGMSYFKTNDRVEGKNLIDHAIKISPEDALVKAVSSYAYQISDRKEDALVALMGALNDDKLQLPKILKARECLDLGDTQCAREQWNKILEVNPKSLAALAGAAEIEMENNNIIESKKFIEAGLSIAPQYQPLLKLKKKIDENKM